MSLDNSKSARSAVAGHRPPFRNRTLAVSILLLLSFTVFTLITRCIVLGKNSEPEHKTIAEIKQSYDFKFGPNPFAPSNATSTSGEFITGDKFLPASRCAQCHTDAHAQWRQSAHANAFREPFYQKNVKDLISQKGIEYTRHCESCHNPAALFSGALTKNAKIKRPFDNDGVSCIACHSIQSVSGRGIGGYVMGEPALLIRDDGTRLLEVTDQQILDDIPSHRRAMMRPVLRSSEFCGSCHKSQVPHELNDYKFLRAFAVYDEFQMSSFSKESPHPFYTRDKESCQSCHMKREPAPLFDASAKQGLLKTHRWAAANTAIPYFYKWPEQLEAVNKSLQTDALGVDIFAIRRKSPGISTEDFVAPLNHSSFTLKAGDRITAEVVVTNKNIAHSFPPELRDFYEAYIEFTVSDGAGKTLYKSGFIKPNGYLDESAHNYKTYLVKGDGNFNDKHLIWKTHVVAQNNQIASGRSDLARYQFRIPVSAEGALNITAKLQYRRFTRVFSDYALGHSIDYPIVTMASSHYNLNIGENSPVQAQSEKGALPEWRRWNNYGIALFDQRQYPMAIDAFSKVAELDEKYKPMARVNRALALIEISRYDEAAALLSSILESDPGNMRAMFQHGRILMRRGQLGEAEDEFRKVLAAYPRDRVALQELGELCKIKRDFVKARDCYEQILRIDPEDTGSHYNLMLVYRKLGMKEESLKEAKIFADLKDDPSATPLANEFLHRHREMSNESVYWHVHDLSSPTGE